MTVRTPLAPPQVPPRSSWFPWRHHQHRHPAIRAAEDQRTYGERVADEIASFGGSWPFIFIFLGMIVVWMLVNALLIQHVLGRAALRPLPIHLRAEPGPLRPVCCLHVKSSARAVSLPQLKPPAQRGG